MPGPLIFTQFIEFSFLKNQNESGVKKQRGCEIQCIMYESHIKMTFIVTESKPPDATRQTFCWWTVSRFHKICRLTPHARSHQVGEYTVEEWAADWATQSPRSFRSKLGYICHSLCSCHKFLASVSSLYRMYCHASVPEQGGIPQQGLKVLTCQKADGMVALYWSAVISGCVIRNSAELPYLEEEERRPWGKLRLWQEFIIAFHPIYIDFVPICARPPREEKARRLIWCSRARRILGLYEVKNAHQM